MAKELTENQKKVYNIMKEQFANGGFADEVVEKIEGLSIASVRATLTSLAKKELMTKTKGIYQDKEKTKYTPVDAEIA